MTTNNYSEVAFKDFNSIKEFSDAHLFEIASGSLKINNYAVKVRFIDPVEKKFGYTGLGHFFFFDDCMYLITTDSKYAEYHNPDMLEFSEKLDILKYTEEFIVRVIFAGVFTGFYDDKNNRIFTGDFVGANIIINPSNPSSGGTKRASDGDNNHPGPLFEAGVNVVMNQFAIILDNHYLPLSWATKIKVLGSFFYDLEIGTTSVDIRQLCSSFAQSRGDKTEFFELVSRSPNFINGKNEQNSRRLEKLENEHFEWIANKTHFDSYSYEFKTKTMDEKLLNLALYLKEGGDLHYAIEFYKEEKSEYTLCSLTNTLVYYIEYIRTRDSLDLLGTMLKEFLNEYQLICILSEELKSRLTVDYKKDFNSSDVKTIDTIRIGGFNIEEYLKPSNLSRRERLIKIFRADLREDFDVGDFDDTIEI